MNVNSLSILTYTTALVLELLQQSPDFMFLIVVAHALVLISPTLLL